MLWRALGDVEAGFFIDVGAQHPIKDSVSKIFSEHDWRGIHVEPTPKFADMLRADRPNEMVIAAVVSKRQGVVTFFNIFDTGLSTGRRDIAEAHAAAGYPYQEITVPTLSLDDLLALAPSDDIHWLKIDVEGMELEVLESWRTSQRRPWIVVIEANLPGSQTPSHEAWEELILTKGYHFVYYDGLNRFYVSNAHSALNDHFALPPNIFDGFQFDPLSDHAIIVQRLHEAEIEAFESRIAALNNNLAEMRAETDTLSKQCRINVEHRIADLRRTADAELANLRERERDGAIAAAADKARLEQQIAALRAQGEEAVNRATAAEAARFHTRLAEERIVLQASEERVAAALARVSETQHALCQAREAAAVQERSIRDQMLAALERLRVEAKQDAEQLRKEAERQQAESQALLVDAHNRIAAAEHTAAERALAHHAAILKQTEAFRDKISHISDAATERERLAQFRIAELERREQQTIAAAHAQNEALAIQLSHSEDRMRTVISSRSWTLAKPLRWLFREQMIDQPSSKPALISAFPTVSLPFGHTEPQDVMTITFKPAQSILDLLALSASDLVNWSFQFLLGRVPSSSERRARTRSLHLGCGRIAMIAEIHQSVEAKDYRSRRRAKGSDTEFIEWLYRHYVGRSPDPDGFAHYEGLIKRKDRAAVEADVAASNEAIEHGPLSYELERLVKIYQRSRQWWRWFDRGRSERQIRNIENEVNAARIAQKIAQNKEDVQADISSIVAQPDSNNSSDLPANNDNFLSLPPRDRHAILVLSSFFQYPVK